MDNDLPICRNCIHYEPKTSECRAFTPSFNVMEESGFGIWPKVDPNTGWCGQFDDGEDYEFIAEN